MNQFLKIFTLIAIFASPVLSQAFDPRFEYDPNYSIKKIKQTSRNTCLPGQRPSRRNKCKYFRKYDAELSAINPMTGGDYSIPFELYKTNKEGQNPVVLLIPPLGGITRVDTDIAVYLANKGVNTIIAVNPEDIADVKRPVDDIDGFLIRTTISMRILLDFAEEQSFIDSNKVGAFGASLGGIRLLTLLGVDDRVDASVVYVGAGNIPEVLAHSEQDVIQNYREHKLKELQITQEEYLDLLSQVVTVDPLNQVHYIDPENVFLKISNKDKSVPTVNQWETQKAIGTQHYKTTGHGHVRAVVDAMFYKSDIYSFLKNRW